MKETWATISGWANYDVSSLGRVRSWNCRSRRRAEPRVMRPRVDGKGYARITLCHGGTQRERFIHQLVLEAFVGDRPSPAHEGRHLDGMRSNNAATNVEWSTHSENMRDQYKHGTRARCETHGMVKLSREQVEAVRSHPGMLKDVAAKFGISKSHACRLRQGRGWSTQATDSQGLETLNRAAG